MGENCAAASANLAITYGDGSPSANVYNQAEIDAEYGYRPPHRATTVKRKARQWARCTRRKAWHLLREHVPILRWLPAYNVRRDALADLTAGVIVGIVHIPQGMAYSVLAGLAPVYGLYVNLFATLVYMIVGQCVDASIGVFAVVSLMIGEAKADFCDTGGIQCWRSAAALLNQTGRNAGAEPPPHLLHFTDVEVATVLCLLVGLCHLLMGLLRMGFVTSYMSEQVVRGYTTAAAIYVFTSQVPPFLGISTKRRGGHGALILRWVDIGEKIGSTNLVTLLVSAASAAALLLGKVLVNPRVKPKIGVPLPFDLFIIIVVTVLSYLLAFDSAYSVSIVGEIPTGFEGILAVPPLWRAGWRLVSDAVGIAIVAYAVAISMEKLFGKKHGYRVKPNEELLALGTVNAAICFFSCFPSALALARSLVLFEAAPRTQMTGAVVAALLTVVLTLAAPLLRDLPMCILATIILVALKGMFKQFGDLPKLWRLSKVDLAVWIVAFVATVGLSVKEGLIVAIVFALGTTIVRNQWPSTVTLARLPDSQVYRDAKRYERSAPVDESTARLYRFDAPLMFTNAERFVARLYEHTGVDPLRRPKAGERPYPRFVIVDCSTLTYVDLAGVNALREAHDDLRNVGVRLLLAAVRGNAMETLRTCAFAERVGAACLLPSVHHAVLYAGGQAAAEGIDPRAGEVETEASASGDGDVQLRAVGPPAARQPTDSAPL